MDRSSARTRAGSHFTGTICALPEDGILRADDLSCVEWKMVDGKPEPTYVLKYAHNRKMA